MKNIFLLGATGSIGLQALEVMLENLDDFSVIGLSLGSNDRMNRNILNHIRPEIASARTQEQMQDYRIRYPEITWTYGRKGLIDVASYPKSGLLINALSGAAGLEPTLTALDHAKDIALANKETLVMAGDLVMERVAKNQRKLYPIDSEHSALWQLIDGTELDGIERVVLTASGGALRDLDREELANVSPAKALAHPNWSMGDKITIDSATMMNKGLEVIEAHHLFSLPYEKIATVLHRESMVHALVYFKDGTVKASLSAADMRIPIAYALFYPERRRRKSDFELRSLTFEPLDLKRFPLLAQAYRAGKNKGLMPTIMNAANEAAVELFLERRITFLDIERIVTDALDAYPDRPNPSLEEIITMNERVYHDIQARHKGR
ncbi:MAG: 1-deoxy-D-xylulose-5-phosphate reductoisomerase [Acholeplasmataceae bacterium]